MLDVGGTVVCGTVVTGASGIVVTGDGAGTVVTGTVTGVVVAGIVVGGAVVGTGRGRKRSITALTVSVVLRDSSLGVKSRMSKSAFRASTSS